MELITIKELSQLIKVKQSTLYSWSSSGMIPLYKLNGLLRFDLDEIEEWVKRSRSEAKLSQRLEIKTNGNLSIDAIVKRVINEVKGKSHLTKK